MENAWVELYRRATGWGDAHPLGSVAIDGVDLGLLADGTLDGGNPLALLRADVMSHHLLLIEEPETGVHPGLLAGLLDTIDAYTVDRQVIISTHSPQVVSWAQPQELRVVTRQEGKTQVRPLSEQQVALFLKYLHDQTLGDFVYSGALDDEG
ncbi:MAG: AAA family ATPase [Polyangia bacterium]